MRVVIIDISQCSEYAVIIDEGVPAASCGGSLDEYHEVVIGDAKERIHAGLDILGVFLDVVLVNLTGVVCELYKEL